MKSTPMLLAMSTLLLLVSGVAIAAPQTPLDRASALMDNKDYKGAIAILDGVLRTDQKNARAFAMRADSKDQIDDLQGAYADYSTALEINPQYEYAYSGRCGIDNELGHYKDAVGDCDQALALRRDDDFAYRSRSYAYFYLDDYELASGDAEQAMAIDKSNGWNMLARCRADVGVRRLNEAAAACEGAVAMLPQNSGAYFYRARVEYLTDRSDAAASDFRKSLEIDPTDDVDHYWLGIIALDQKKFSDAVDEANAYLKNNANDADTLLLRARGEAGLGKTDQAKYDAHQALLQYQIDNNTDGMHDAQSFLDTLSH